MRIGKLSLIALAVLGSFMPRMAAAAEEYNIMVSGGGGTQAAIARDIAGLGSACGMPLNVVGSKGSLENFFGVRNRPHTQFGVVDGDILNYMTSYQGGNNDVHQAVQGMRIMLPLFDAEVHVVAREGIRTLQDLRGKRLGVGDQDGTAYLTSQLMFDILRIELAERVKGSVDDMIELLRQGEIDAMIRVGGAPLSALADGRIDESFHLVPITDDVLRASYRQVSLPANTYAWQKTPVQTVAVKTMLMTYEYGSEKNAYYRDSCKAVADFTSLIVEHIDELRRTGHPKWKAVNLTEIPKGWEIGTCVRRGLDPNYKVQCSKTAESSSNQEYLDLLRQRLKN